MLPLPVGCLGFDPSPVSLTPSIVLVPERMAFNKKSKKILSVR
jgi:hypothetical protein